MPAAPKHDTGHQTEPVRELRAAIPADVLSTVLDELSLTIVRDSAPNGATDVDARWVGHLRRISALKLRACGLSALVEDAQLLISELVTNGLRYGTDRRIVFRLAIDTHAVLMEVNDGSPGRAQVREAGSEEESGRGMFLVAALADAWGVSPDGTKTWCTLTTSTPLRSAR